MLRNFEFAFELQFFYAVILKITVIFIHGRHVSTKYSHVVYPVEY